MVTVVQNEIINGVGSLLCILQILEIMDNVQSEQLRRSLQSISSLASILRSKALELEARRNANKRIEEGVENQKKFEINGLIYEMNANLQSVINHFLREEDRTTQPEIPRVKEVSQEEEEKVESEKGEEKSVSDISDISDEFFSQGSE